MEDLQNTASKKNDFGASPLTQFEKDLESVYKNDYVEIFNFVYRRVERKEDAADILSSAFLKALSNHKKFTKHNSGSLKSWIFKIAANEVLLFYRRKKVEQKYFIEQQYLKNFASEINDEPETIELLKECLESLKYDEYELVHKKYFDNLQFKEIAVITGKSEESLRVGLHRIRKKMNKMILQMARSKGLEIVLTIAVLLLNFKF